MAPTGPLWLEVWIRELSQDLMHHGQTGNADHGNSGDDNQREHLAVSKMAAENRATLGQIRHTEKDRWAGPTGPRVSLGCGPDQSVAAILSISCRARKGSG
jgi:hypothetical protein